MMEVAPRSLPPVQARPAIFLSRSFISASQGSGGVRTPLFHAQAHIPPAPRRACDIEYINNYFIY
jgi:hypothetical protein